VCNLPRRIGRFPQALRQNTEVTISSKGAQEKDGQHLQVTQEVQIDYRDYTLRADEID